MNKSLRGIGAYLLIAVAIILIVALFYNEPQQVAQLRYDQLLESIEAGLVREATVIGESRVAGELTDGTQFEAPLIAGTASRVADLLVVNGVEVDAEPEPQPPWWMAFAPNLFLIIAFVAIWGFMLNQMQGGGGNRAMSFGKSRAKLHNEDRPKVTFGDVAGVDEAEQDLAEVVDFLANPKKFVEVGATIPRGILLVGPPGTGKTLLARAVAGEAGVPFFSISGSDFVEMFVGVGASRVRDLFDNAKKNAPCIVFVDEIDAVGRQRGAGLGGGHDEREQTLNQLLVEMDGFEANNGVIILAATNRPDVLDPALLRPGRFDRQVVVDRPDLKGRTEILEIYIRNKPLDDSVDTDLLAKMTPGFTGADLQNLMNEAAILTARRGKKKIGMDECEEAIDKILMGPERPNRILREQDRKYLAYHEAGHAVLAYVLPHADPIRKITIVGRGMAGGYVSQYPVEDRLMHTKSELLERIVVALGGRVSEELVFNGEVATGATSDLEYASKLAKRMVTQFGMSELLGPISFHRGESQVFLGRDFTHERDYSDEVAALIDREVRKILEECYQRARDLLVQNRDQLDRLVHVLLEKEAISREEIDQVFKEISDRE